MLLLPDAQMIDVDDEMVGSSRCGLSWLRVQGPELFGSWGLGAYDYN